MAKITEELTSLYSRGSNKRGGSEGKRGGRWAYPAVRQDGETEEAYGGDGFPDDDQLADPEAVQETLDEERNWAWNEGVKQGAWQALVAYQG